MGRRSGPARARAGRRLARQVNRDLIAALLPDETIDIVELYGWLYSQSFVTQTVSSWYHDLVREPMIRLSRSQSRQEWQEAHRRLARTYREWLERLGQSDKDGKNNETWEDYLLEECYHRLCADLTNALPEIMDLAVKSYSEGPTSIRRWVDMVVHVGQDADVPPLAAWGRQLQTMLDTEDDGLPIFLDGLLRESMVSCQRSKARLPMRGYQHYLADRYTEAVTDFTTAINLDSEYVWAITGAARPTG